VSPHRIIIRGEPFGQGFDVTVEPTLEGQSFDREYPTHKETRGYAGGLHILRGWRIVDESSGA
jgi:hypothetical protein